MDHLEADPLDHLEVDSLDTQEADHLVGHLAVPQTIHLVHLGHGEFRIHHSTHQDQVADQEAEVVEAIQVALVTHLQLQESNHHQQPD